MGLTRQQLKERKFSLYFIRCPFTQVVKYVGITSNVKYRKQCHRSMKDGCPAKKRWVKEVKNAGERFDLEVKFTGLCIESARRLEHLLICLFAIRYPNQLVNGRSRAAFSSTTEGVSLNVTDRNTELQNALLAKEPSHHEKGLLGLPRKQMYFVQNDDGGISLLVDEYESTRIEDLLKRQLSQSLQEVA